MTIVYSKKFIKLLQKSPFSIQKAFRNRLELFLQEPQHPTLRFHALHGELEGYHSINVTGDWRAIFRFIDGQQEIFFVSIGTHSQLYR